MSILTLKSTIPVVSAVLELYKNKQTCSTLFATEEYEISMDHDEYSSRITISTMKDDRRNDIISIQIDDNYKLKYSEKFSYNVLFGKGSVRHKMYVTTHVDSELPKNIEFRNFTEASSMGLKLPRYIEDEQFFMFSTVHKLPEHEQFKSTDQIIDMITGNIESVSAKVSYLDIDIEDETYDKWLNIIWGLVNVTKQC